MAVFHSGLLTFAVAFNLPQPSSSVLRVALISLASSVGIEIKCHPPAESCCH